MEAWSWREVEVRRRRSGAPAVRLHGAVAARADELGVQRAAMSLTHTDSDAGAAAIAVAAMTLPAWLEPLPDAAQQRALDAGRSRSSAIPGSS